MTMAEATVLTTYWRDHPPLHVVMGGRVKAVRGTGSDLAALMGADPGAKGRQAMRV
jgi:hypothetical protein